MAGERKRALLRRYDRCDLAMRIAWIAFIVGVCVGFLSCHTWPDWVVEFVNGRRIQ